jgi:hypothetical protein|tara:strand:+ start:364 stop:477 length:114 start_codon:yes stop_codon:yes gene_type:complete
MANEGLRMATGEMAKKDLQVAAVQWELMVNLMDLEDL